MRRREFILVIGGAAVALPMLARAQTASVKRIGVIYQGGPFETSIEGLREGLRAAGLEEGRHVALLIRNTKGDAAAAEAAARALERDDKVDVIVALSTSMALPAKRATEVSPSSSMPVRAAAVPATVSNQLPRTLLLSWAGSQTSTSWRLLRFRG